MDNGGYDDEGPYDHDAAPRWPGGSGAVGAPEAPGLRYPRGRGAEAGGGDGGDGEGKSRPAAGRHSAPGSRVALPRTSTALVVIVGVIVLAVAAGAVGFVILTRPKPKPATPLAEAYLAAWSRKDFAAMAAMVDFPPADFVAVHQSVLANLGLSSWQLQLGKVTTSGNTAVAKFTERLNLGGLGTWSVQNGLHLARLSGNWKVEWTPGTIYPKLPVGGHLVLQDVWPTRASVLGTNATVLAGSTAQVTVGLQGNAVTSPALVTSALTQVGVAADVIANALKMAAAHPLEFIPVTTLSEARYEQVKPIIFPIPGTRFQMQTGSMSATPDLQAHVVGSVAPVTAQQLKQLGAPYQTGDNVGQIGIESQYEHQLAGLPDATIQVVGADGSVVGTADHFAAKPGVSVQTTLDLATQEAAESALNGVAQPAALVAVQASTGNVLAAVSRPDNTSFDRALQGQYPPGSTFKVITSDALLSNGLTPESPATCPMTITVDGYTFHNFDGESALNANLLQAFEQSCNAAFIGLAQNLASTALVSAANQFGFGTTPQPGLPVFGGQIPSPADEVEKVADSIGQGRVLASPLQMAEVAAAVDSGSFHAPRIVMGAPDDTAAPIALNPAVVANLRTMMAGVVTNGTGTAADLSGAPVYGKTGTAEFGNANPPMTHAWFIGFRGDVAFAVIVEGGGVGGAVAAPIAARFLRALASNSPG
ncbi:MAG: penicillin-binding transpeptidase domain-containing protein [Acidimicrobiales bacterium]